MAEKITPDLAIELSRNRVTLVALGDGKYVAITAVMVPHASLFVADRMDDLPSWLEAMERTER